MSASGKSSPFRGVTLFRPTMKWRAQISADGKTTSLGDHDTEEQAAVAFDRACINKLGMDAKTNFPLSNYRDEIEDLRAMSQVELVAMLRAKARKSYQQTSHFRGVSLLKQTNKWHAQINVGGKQVHLGFFPTEEFAARAYDRAAINKGAKEPNKGKITTNFDIMDYVDELDLLRRISQEDLIEALSNEGKRKQAYEMVSEGSSASTLLGKRAPVTKTQSAKDKAALEALCAKAERAQPKSTARNPLYLDFGKPKKASKTDEEGPSSSSPAASGAQDSGPAPQPAAKLGRLFAGANLPSLEGGPAIALPLIDQVTGAPAAVLSVPYPSVQPAVQHTPVSAAKKTPASPKTAARKATAKPAAPTKTGRPRGRPPKRLLVTEEEPHKAIEPAPEASLSVAPVMPVTPGNNRQAPPLPPSRDPMVLYGAAAFARYAKFLAPATELEPLPAAAPKPQAAKTPTRTKELTSIQIPTTAAPSVPPTPPQKRQRTSLRVAAKQSPSRGEAGNLEALAVAASQDGRAPPRTLQEKLRQQEADHKRQQAEQRALVSDVIDHLMGVLEALKRQRVQGLPAAETIRPLTKRQEALAAKKQEEAAATLAAARQQSPLPDEVGDALMDFAAAAELAELQDQECEQGGSGRTATEGANPASALRATSVLTGSTVTDPEVPDDGVKNREYTSTRGRATGARVAKA